MLYKLHVNQEFYSALRHCGVTLSNSTPFEQIQVVMPAAPPAFRSLALVATTTSSGSSAFSSLAPTTPLPNATEALLESNPNSAAVANFAFVFVLSAAFLVVSVWSCNTPRTGTHEGE